MQIHFLKFEHKPIVEIFEEEELEEEGNLTILVVVLYDTPEDEIERSLVENDNVIGDIDKEEIDEYLDSSPVVDTFMNKIYEIPERKGDEALPPPELKHLPPDLKYRFLDDTNKYLITLGLQVQSVASAEYLPHKGDSGVYIELSGNLLKEYSLQSSSSNPASKINALCPQPHRVVVKHKVSRK
jgi:hypothetical protein